MPAMEIDEAELKRLDAALAGMVYQYGPRPEVLF